MPSKIYEAASRSKLAGCVHCKMLFACRKGASLPLCKFNLTASGPESCRPSVGMSVDPESKGVRWVLAGGKLEHWIACV